MPHDYSVINAEGDRKAGTGNGKPEPESAMLTYSPCKTRAKKRAFVFAGLLLLASFVLVAMSDQRVGAEIEARQLLGKIRSVETEISVRQFPALLCLGIGAGLFAGMLGQGGGVLKIAGMLLFFELDMFFARAVSLATMFFAAASAIWPYIQSGFPIWRVIRSMLPPAVLGLVGGVLLGSHLRGTTLTYLFGFFVLFLGFYTMAMVFDDPREYISKIDFLDGRLQKHHGCVSGSIGAFQGFFCGLLGISGGVVSVPMQQVLLDVPARNAIANSLVVSALCSGLGSVIVITIGVGRGAFSLDHILFAVLCIGSGAVLGAQIGVRMGAKTSTELLKFLFVVISFGAGLALLT